MRALVADGLERLKAARDVMACPKAALFVSSPLAHPLALDNLPAHEAARLTTCPA